ETTVPVAPGAPRCPGDQPPRHLNRLVWRRDLGFGWSTQISSIGHLDGGPGQGVGVRNPLSYSVASAGALSSVDPSTSPALNSRDAWPTDRASLGRRLEPKTSRPITRMISSSGAPRSMILLLHNHALAV